MKGNIHIDAGGNVRIDGRVAGDMDNHGGELSIFGRVSGRVQAQSGTTYVDPESS